MDASKDTPLETGTEGEDAAATNALATSAPNEEPIKDASDEDAEADPAPNGDVAQAKTLLEDIEADVEEGLEKVKEVAVEGIHKVEDALGIKHGTYDAAKSGLQTDGSGTYTPPARPPAG